MWKKVIRKVSAAAAFGDSGGIVGSCNRILPSTSHVVFAPSGYSKIQRHHHLLQSFVRKYHLRSNHLYLSCYTENSCDLYRLPRWPYRYDDRRMPMILQGCLREQQRFQTGATTNDPSEQIRDVSGSNSGQKKKRNAGQKQANAAKTPTAIQTIVGNMGMDQKECCEYLVSECSESRGIELNKRQCLKPWIMALLIHRYDRGIRDINELNEDSVFYDSIKRTSDSVPVPPIDLRRVLTPEPNEINSYMDRQISNNSINQQEPKQETVSEILRHEKLALLAKEARRVLIDREIPIQNLSNLNEAELRRMSKKTPSVFLSVFSRAFCISERKRPKKSSKSQQPRSIDFSYRRFHPPSLKAASHKKKKLQNQKKKRDANSQNPKITNTNGSNNHANMPKELREKMRTMMQRKR